MSNQQDFIARIAPFAQEIQRKYGIPASVAIAQACLETGYGSKALGNNFYGVKGSNNGQSVAFRTSEYTAGGSKYTIIDNFRVYGGFAESIEGYAKFLSKSRYKNAFNYANDPDAFVREVARAGYATAPDYADQVSSIMRRYNLKQYDDPNASPVMAQRLDFTNRYRSGEVTSPAEISAEEQMRRQLLYSLGYEKPAVDAMSKEQLLGDDFTLRFTAGLIKSLIDHISKPGPQITTSMGAVTEIATGTNVSPLPAPREGGKPKTQSV